MHRSLPSLGGKQGLSYTTMIEIVEPGSANFVPFEVCGFSVETYGQAASRKAGQPLESLRCLP